MFQNIKDLLDKLKLIKEAVSTGNIDKIGDAIEEVSKLIGFGQYGVSIDDIMDAVVVGDWAKAAYSLGTLIQTISAQLPGPTSKPVVHGFSFDAVPTMGSPNSLTPALDKMIFNLELAQSTMTNGVDGGEPPTELPIGFYILMGQVGLELFKIWRKRREDKKAVT